MIGFDEQIRKKLLKLYDQTYATMRRLEKKYPDRCEDGDLSLVRCLLNDSAADLGEAYNIFASKTLEGED